MFFYLIKRVVFMMFYRLLDAYCIEYATSNQHLMENQSFRYLMGISVSQNCQSTVLPLQL